jgi:hypothetical protein
MKKMYTLALAALWMAIASSSCKKDSSGEKGLNTASGELTFNAALQPFYVYTLAGNPDNNDQFNGDGKGDQAGFQNLSQLLAKDGYLYALDEYVIRKIKISDSTVTTFAGNLLGGDSRDGLKEQASFLQPTSIAMGPDGNIYVAEYFKVRKVSKEGMVTTIAGSTLGYQDGLAKTAKFGRLTGIGVCKDGSIYVFDNDIHQIRKISTSGVVSTFTSGGPSGTASRFWDFDSISINSKGKIYASGAGIYSVGPKGVVTTIQKAIQVVGSGLLAFDDATLLISTNNQIQKVSANGSVTPFAGVAFSRPFQRPAEGPADSVDLLTPTGFTIENNVLYFAVHPGTKGPDLPVAQGHVIQMMPLRAM